MEELKQQQQYRTLQIGEDVHYEQVKKDAPMRICPHCGTVNESDALFCEECGTWSQPFVSQLPPTVGSVGRLL